jgi:hypothetical protein
VVKKCPTPDQLCAADTATTASSATRIWTATKATSPVTFQRRTTSPYHMPYRTNTTSSTNEVSHVSYHGPSMIHGIRQ